MKQVQSIPGSDRHQHWFMLRTRQQLEHFNEVPWISKQSRAFLADKVPSNINYTAVKALCIEDAFAHETDFIDIPPSIHLFPSLEYLRLPKKYVPHLQQGEIPASVRVLEIMGKGTVTFLDKLSFPQIEWLKGLPTALKFAKDTFPHLRHLTLRLDSHRTMLPVLAELDQLETLGIGPNHDGAVFAAIGEDRLTTLALGSGKIQTLDGIERLQSLVAVSLTNMDKLENIDGLARLSKLSEVNITWCANLSNYDPLLRISTLQHVEIFSCKKFDMLNYGPKLQSLPLKTMRMPH